MIISWEDRGPSRSLDQRSIDCRRENAGGVGSCASDRGEDGRVRSVSRGCMHRLLGHSGCDGRMFRTVVRDNRRIGVGRTRAGHSGGQQRTEPLGGFRKQRAYLPLPPRIRRARHGPQRKAGGEDQQVGSCDWHGRHLSIRNRDRRAGLLRSDSADVECVVLKQAQAVGGNMSSAGLTVRRWVSSKPASASFR